MIRRISRLALVVLGTATAGVAGVIALSVALDHRLRVRRGRMPLRPPGDQGHAHPAGPALPAPTAEPAAVSRPLRRASAALRLGALTVGWAGAGLALAILAALALSFAAGYRSMTVMSGSMAPAIDTGDVVVNRPIEPGAARVGDVVTFREPGAGDRFITHRVRRITRQGGRITFVTKGDANTGTERWTVPDDGEIGRVEFRLPHLGYALFWTHGRYAILVLITLPALLLGAIVMARIWRPPGEVSRGAQA